MTGAPANGRKTRDLESAAFIPSSSAASPTDILDENREDGLLLG
jgi:hypothetical protein